jgi:hypothetical protein
MAESKCHVTINLMASKNTFYRNSLFLQLNNWYQVWQTYEPLIEFKTANTRISLCHDPHKVPPTSVPDKLFPNIHLVSAFPITTAKDTCLNDFMRRVWRSPLCNALNELLIDIQIYSIYIYIYWLKDIEIQGDKKSPCTWWLRYKELLVSNVQNVPRQSPDSQGQRDTGLTLTPSVIPNSNYVIMVSDWNWLKYFCVFLL